ncbi:MAG: class I SAM-dependent methyltransferase, partial [Chloroflexota bacterium]
MNSPTGKPARSRPLQSMFTAVPSRYDLINRAITWGMDNRWRRKAARECLAGKPQRVLDLCCGTGDLLAHLSRLAAPEVVLAGLDYSLPMLELAREKTQKLNHLPSLVYGDVV